MDIDPPDDRIVILLSSHVARGAVGLHGMAFALERLGFSTWTAPTVLLPHHPGHGPGTRIVPDPERFEAFLGDLAEAAAGRVAAIATGYFADAGQVPAAARLVEAVKAGNPDALYLCDPVIGDSGRLYVAEPLAAAIRDHLLPLADIATPNRFECAWLAGRPDESGDPVVEARALPPATVAVTSCPSLMRGQIGTALVNAETALVAEHRFVQTAAKGTGDVFAALFLGRLLQRSDPEQALQMAAASIFEIVAASAAAGADELMLPRFQASLVQPQSRVGLRRIGGAKAGPRG